MTGKIRLLMVAGTPMLAGGERNLLDLATAAVNHGFDIGLAAPGKGRLTEKVEALGCPVWYAPMPKFPHPASLLKIRRVIKREGYDIVHAHGHLAGLYSRLASLGIEGVKTVYTMHGIHYPHYSGSLKRKAFISGERLLKPITDQYICVCRYDLATGTRLGIIDPDRTAMIYNGIDLEPVIDLARAEKLRGKYDRGGGVVLHVGRFNPQKAHYLLIGSIRKVLESHPDVTFLLAGDGELLECEKARAAGMRIPGESIHFLGHSNEVDSLMAACDFLVLPSLWEGFPYVILEAMRLGKPVIAADVGGVSEIVVHGRNGLLIPPRDPRALSASIVYLLDHKEEAASIGQEAKKSVRGFGLESTTAKTLGLYQNLLTVNSEGIA